jgi:hypothetical protein
MDVSFLTAFWLRTRPLDVTRNGEAQVLARLASPFEDGLRIVTGIRWTRS